MNLERYIFQLEQGWRNVLLPIWGKHKHWIEAFLEEEKRRYKGHVLILPRDDLIFRAFGHFALENLKVVILAAEPFSDMDMADGLAFSVPEHHPAYPSTLMAIHQQLFREYGLWRKKKSLVDWAHQGVLLLNMALTVRQFCPHSHARLWLGFVEDILKVLGTRRNIVFLLWGSFVQKYVHLIDDTRNLVLLHTHPLHSNWLGHGHFKKANEYLMKHRKTHVRWV